MGATYSTRTWQRAVASQLSIFPFRLNTHSTRTWYADKPQRRNARRTQTSKNSGDTSSSRNGKRVYKRYVTEPQRRNARRTQTSKNSGDTSSSRNGERAYKRYVTEPQRRNATYIHCFYFVPKSLSPASPNPGMM